MVVWFSWYSWVAFPMNFHLRRKQTNPRNYFPTIRQKPPNPRIMDLTNSNKSTEPLFSKREIVSFICNFFGLFGNSKRTKLNVSKQARLLISSMKIVDVRNFITCHKYSWISFFFTSLFNFKTQYTQDRRKIFFTVLLICTL